MNAAELIIGLAVNLVSGAIGAAVLYGRLVKIETRIEDIKDRFRIIERKIGL